MRGNADEGISGTGLKNRAGFNHLMDDCRLGLIDRILVKSSSRMARNSVDFLSAVRELKSLGVVVEFEKERFDTDSTEGELLLGMMCAVAQEESLSISKNLRWGIRKRMESGTYRTSSVPYGYKQVNYDLVPAPNQIEIVKDIFNAFLQGESTTKIADDLNRLRPDADKHWHHTTIERILKNEKYAGCSLYQKSYTSDDLPFKRTENNGEVLSYYAPDTHNGIISQADFDKVQALLQRKSVGPCPRKDTAFSKMLYCAKCGSMLSRKINRSSQVTWICRTHLRCAADCSTSPIQEERIQHVFLTILHDLQGGTTELEELQQKLADARQEFDRLLDLSLECDASFLDEKLKHASEEIDSLQKQIDQLTASQQKAANPDLQLTVPDFHITKYSDTLVARIIERIDVVSANEIKIEFIGGYTVTAPLQE